MQELLDGKIFKVSKITDFGINNVFPHNEIGIMIVNPIKKHSSNIIDLIEKGDYVNGHKVHKVKKGRVYIGFCGDCQSYRMIVDSPKHITTIITREYFEADKYWVRGD